MEIDLRPRRSRRRTNLRDHALDAALRRGYLAGHGHGEPELLPGDGVNAHRRSQRGDFEAQLLIQLGRLRFRGLQLLERVAELDAFEVLPGVSQQANAERRAAEHFSPQFAPTLRRGSSHQAGIIDTLQCVVFGHGCPPRDYAAAASNFCATRILALRARGL